MNRRRRTLPPVPPKAPSELRPLIAAMTEILETGEGVRGDPLDRKITLRDLLDSGIGKLRPGMRPGQDGNLDSGALPPAPDLSIPPAPAGFDAQGSFYGMINLSWTIPGQQYRNHAYTNVYRSETDNFANAEIIGQEAGAFYSDFVRDDAIDPDDPTKLKGYYYWISFTSIADIEGPPNSPNGTYAAPIADVGYVIELLTGQIDADVLAQSLKEEIERIGPLENVLNGPESLDGTVANRIAAERERRIAALDAEREERAEGLAFEARARAQAIQAETDNRTTAITQAVNQLTLEDQLLAQQQNVIAAAYNANAASIYSMAQIRIDDNEVFASQIDQLFGTVENNEALLFNERQIRIDQYSAMATQVGILSARLDARPSMASSFEPGSDYDAWQATTGNTLAAETNHVYAGAQAGLITSSQAGEDPQSGGVRRAINPDTARQFAGNEIRVSFYARQATSNASSQFAVAYSVRGEFGAWERFTPTNDYAFYSFVIDVPAGDSTEHAIAIWGDTSGGGGGVLIDRVLVTFAETEIPEVTAAIEQMQEALAEQEQAVARELQTFLARLDANAAAIERETQTRSTAIDALARDVQTFTAKTQQNAADIAAEREAWSSAVEAVAQSVDDMSARVGEAEGRITAEERVRAQEDELLAAIQRVIAASKGASSATFYSLEEVRVTDKEATAQRIDGVQVQLKEARSAFESDIELLTERDLAAGRRLETLQSELNDGIASVRTSMNTEVKRLDGLVSSQASRVDTVQSSLGSDIASVRTSMNTEVKRVDGELKTIGARYTAQVQVNGLIGGFGIHNDGTRVDAGFDVDRFWVGRTNANKRKPFIIQGDVTYQDTAMIRQGSIQEGQLGPITMGKLFLKDGTPVTTVGGLIRAEAIDVDNLSVAEAARFYADVQSGNYIAGRRGWRIRQNGDVEFNQGQFNGRVNVGSVSGLGGLATRDQLAYEDLDGSTASLVLQRANFANDRATSWQRPGSTQINGNQIFSGDAFLDTLQIKGEAVTAVASATTNGGMVISPSNGWVNVQTLLITRNSTGSPVSILGVAFLRMSWSLPRDTLAQSVRARLWDNTNNAGITIDCLVASTPPEQQFSIANPIVLMGRVPSNWSNRQVSMQVLVKKYAGSTQSQANCVIEGRSMEATTTKR